MHGRRAFAGGAGDAGREFYYSVHGARAPERGASSRQFSSVHGGEGPNPGAFLLKPSGTAVMLSEMAPGVATPGDSWRCAPASAASSGVVHGKRAASGGLRAHPRSHCCRQATGMQRVCQCSDACLACSPAPSVADHLTCTEACTVISSIIRTPVATAWGAFTTKVALRNVSLRGWRGAGTARSW